MVHSQSACGLHLTRARHWSQSQRAALFWVDLRRGSGRSLQTSYRSSRGDPFGPDLTRRFIWLDTRDLDQWMSLLQREERESCHHVISMSPLTAIYCNRSVQWRIENSGLLYGKFLEWESSPLMGDKHREDVFWKIFCRSNRISDGNWWCLMLLTAKLLFSRHEHFDKLAYISTQQ